MMKKWSKVGLLAAVTAFMLAALPAYSAGKAGPINFDPTHASSAMGKHLNGLEKKAAIKDGTYDGVTVTNATRANDSSKLTLEIAREGGSVSFSVSKGANVVIAVGSTNNSNVSVYTVTGAGLDKENASVTGTSYAKTDLGTAKSDGTVTISIPAGAERGMRIRGITVTY